MNKSIFILFLIASIFCSCEKVEDELYQPFLENEEGKIVNPNGADTVRVEPKPTSETEDGNIAPVNSGKWYLRDYDVTPAVFNNPNLSFVTWGEYLHFSENDPEELLWMRRKGDGVASVFTYTFNGSEIQLSSWRGESYTFVVSRHTEEVLCLSCSDGYYRFFTRARK